MARFENKQGINEITMYKKIHNLCTIGQDWYTNKLTIRVAPYKTIPDYIEIDKELNELEGKELIIEDVVSKVVDILKQYEPYAIIVVSEVDDATHLAVKVEKEWTR